MNTKNQHMSAARMPRRRFIASCAACTSCLALSPFLSMSSFGLTGAARKMKLRIIYSLHELVQPKPDWPNIGFNFEPVIRNMNAELRKQFPSWEFISTLAQGEAEAKKILEQDKSTPVDGYIVFQLNCWNRVVQTIAQSNKPVLYADFQYGGSGGFLVYNSSFIRDQQPNVGFVSSSRTDDLIAAVRCFEITGNGGTNESFVQATREARRKLTPAPENQVCKKEPLKTLSAEDCRRRMGESAILAVRDNEARSGDSVMGIPLQYISFAEVNDAWEKADRDEAASIAGNWKGKALGVVGVSFSELQNSAAMYLGMKSVLKNHRANAITINCLGGFYGNHIQAYPCLGFHELNNEGLIGACECDIASTATMVAMTTMTKGRPGYISDPVIDTSKRRIIYAHCVAPNKMFGPDGPSNPYVIMNHSEDRQGAAVRSMLPTGYLTTSLKINNDRKEIIFHQAKAVANDPDDRACRTKLCAEPVGDVEKLFTEWDRWGWHRVTFYGDLKEPVYALADSMGWKVIEEA